MTTRSSLLVLSSLGILLAPLAHAQTVGRLEPDAWSVTPGSPTSVALVRVDSSGASRRSFPTARALDWFFLRAGGDQDNFEQPDRVGEGERARARVALTHIDTNLIGLDLSPYVEVVDAASWTSFLDERVGRPDLARSFREESAPAEWKLRRVESCKLLVRVGQQSGAPAPSATAQSKTGQAVELRPLADPTAVPPGSDLPLRAYVPTGSAEGLRVTARHRSSGTVRHLTTRSGGVVDVHVTASGPWTIEVHQVVPLHGDPRADWEVRSATLAFAAPGDSRPVEGGKDK